MWVTRLVSPTAEQVERIASVWTSALQNGITHAAWMVQANAGMDHSVLVESFRARARIATQDGWVWVAGEKEGMIHGAVHCNFPGYTFGESRTSPEGFPTFQDRLDPTFYKWKKEKYIPWVMQAFDRAYTGTGTDVKSSMYVSILGVSPDGQGKGVGRALMGAVEEEAKRLGVDVTLMSPDVKAVKFYESLGFEQRGYDELEVVGERRPGWVLLKKLR